MKRIIKYWLSPKIPNQYLYPNYENLNYFQKIKSFFVHWFAHPIKRRISKYYCFLLQKLFGLKVVAITGSSGKTTTKEMVSSILKLNAKTVYSFKNIDPVFNIPTTILKCSPLTRYLILEMGVEYPHEMDFYLWLVKPDIAVITSIFPTHTEFFKDVKGVYKEKIKLAEAVKNGGFLVLNNESKMLSRYSKGKNNVILYGKNSQLYFSNISFTINGTRYFLNYENLQIEISTVGRANVLNSLAAIAVAKKLNIGLGVIKNGLKRFKPLKNRLNVFKKRGVLVIDDTYNSNPEALKESLNVFDYFSKGKNKLLVIGDMLELGELSKTYHEEIARSLLKLGFNFLVCVGKESKVIFDYLEEKQERKRCFWVGNQKDVDILLKPQLKSNSVVLFKASHSIELNNVIDRLFK